MNIKETATYPAIDIHSLIKTIPIKLHEAVEYY